MPRKIPEVDTRFLCELDLLKPTEGAVDAIDWGTVFGREAPLRIEIGVGNSPFLIDVARLEPECNYLGIEYARKRALKFIVRVNASGLQNIRMLSVHAGKIFEGAIAPGRLDHLFINFPDPWPKRRQARQRFVQPKFIAPVIRALRSGGGLSLKTDSPDYAKQMLEVLDDFEELENLAGHGEMSEEPRFPFPTPFELLWREEGRAIHFLEYRRV